MPTGTCSNRSVTRWSLALVAKRLQISVWRLNIHLVVLSSPYIAGLHPAKFVVIVLSHRIPIF